MPTIEFYDASDSCPFAQRAWLTLTEKSLPFERKLINLGNKPKFFTDLYAAVYPDPAAKAKVPVIIDGNDTITESNLVAEYLDHKYADAGPKLFPTNALKLFKVRWFVEIFPQNFNARLFALLGAESQAAAQSAKLKLDSGLKVIDAFICQHGSNEGGDYFSEEYSFAEVATTPFLHRGAVALSAHRGYDVQKAIQILKLQRFGAWMQAALARPSYVKTKPQDSTIPEGYADDVGKWVGHIQQ